MTSSAEVARWQQRRDRARSREAWREARTELPCVAMPLPFLLTLDAHRPAVKEAKRLCRRCPLQQDCLVEALEQERGMIATNRIGIRAGLTPNERARLAHSAGCAACGAELEGDDRSQFCSAHSGRAAAAAMRGAS